ncbi:MAG: class I SAM-dependent methyltransferase [Desulfobulbaceae bacterium]|nr:class I SAM-dependent methyltransferase [Desulfobulbaceae bacterium]
MKNIDWELLRRRHPQGLPKQSSRENWNKKALDFSTRAQDPSYVSQFLSLMKPKKNWRVIDVGAGPGTLALPLAKMVSHVTALDFSQKMLSIAQNSAAQEGVKNISTHLLAWEDSWKQAGISPHNVTIASRSLNLPALKPALEKLSRFAFEQVFITDRVGSGPYDPAAFKAIGRTLSPGPDYIYTINILYQMGHYAKVDFIEAEPRCHYSSFKAAYESFSWMFNEINDDEQNKLREYITSLCHFHQDGSVTVHRNHRPTWAFINWQTRFSPPDHRPCNNIRNDL